MNTQILTVKIDPNTNSILSLLASKQGRTKSKIVRSAIRNYIQDKTPSAGESLVKMAKNAKRYNYNAPKDAITNLNRYLYAKP